MRAWQISRFETPLVFIDVPRPEPGPGEVLIRIRATGLNFADLLMMKGTYQETPTPPFSPGLEVAGVIEAIGEGVDTVSPGQRVAAYTGQGGLAEYIVTGAERCLALPDAMDYLTAAGFQIAYGTSHIALVRRARLRAGERLVVLGAAGGVGLTAVEIGRALGAEITAVARGADRLDIARMAGADHLIDSGAQEDMVAVLKNAGPFDMIYDAVGGALADAALRAVSPEARHLLIGFASGDLPRLKPNHLLVKNTDVIGVNWPAYLRFAPDVLRESLAEVIEWHATGRLRPQVDFTFDLSDADKALELLKSRQSTGKIVVTQ